VSAADSGGTIGLLLDDANDDTDTGEEGHEVEDETGDIGGRESGDIGSSI